MTTKEYNTAVKDYADGLYRFVLKNIGDEEAAGDIVQDSFEKVWLKVSEIACDKAKSYLFTTAYHTMIDSIRKNKRMQAMAESEMNIVGADTQYTDLQEVLHKAINKLPDDQRAVILLRDYEGYSYKEIAEITELNESQVKVYIYRARLFLKNYIGDMAVLI